MFAPLRTSALVRNRVTAHGADTWIIAKLEKPQAVEHLDAILQVSDGIMVARGDLGVEVPPEKVPAIQKHIIRRAAEYSKPVITATQMLESMIENPRPTRAEVSDVANAIYDGTDAVMLSGESAIGKYPVEAVAMMARIVSETERHIKENLETQPRERRSGLSIAETICEATAHAADDLDLRGIALFTESGSTARQLSKYHPAAPIFALSPVDVTVNRLNLLWGTTPIRCPKVNSTEALVDCAETLLEKGGYVRPREVIAIVAGTRTKSGSTNFLRLHAMGENLLNGLRFRAPRTAARRARSCRAQKAPRRPHRQSGRSTAIAPRPQHNVARPNRLVATLCSAGCMLSRSPNSMLRAGSVRSQGEIMFEGSTFNPGFLDLVIGILVVLLIVLIFKSIYSIGPTQIGLVRKRFGAKLPGSNPVAFKGEAGYQAELLMPGLRFKFCLIYAVAKHPWVQVPAGQIGVVIAQVGEATPIGAKVGCLQNRVRQLH